jgi:hypothetical protein
VKPPRHLQRGLDPVSWLAFADWLEENCPGEVQIRKSWRRRARIATPIVAFCKADRVTSHRPGTVIHTEYGDGWRMSLLAWWTPKSLWLRVDKEKVSGPGTVMIGGFRASVQEFSLATHEERRLIGAYAYYAVRPEKDTTVVFYHKKYVSYLRRRLFALADDWQRWIEEFRKKGLSDL